jgi:dual specificity MAP kinase phosphatase
MDAKAVDADAIFRVFTACANDPKTLLLDVRPQKEYKKVWVPVGLRSSRVIITQISLFSAVLSAHVVQGHINQAFNPRLATNGKFLADYSQAQYSMPWSQDCW